TVELSTWKITDVRSSSFGLTLVWLEIRESDSLVSVEKANGQAIPSTAPAADVLAILSGGTWTGQYDAPNSAKQASGLVVSNGAQVSAFTPATTGGVLYACKDDLLVVDAAAYAKKFANQKLPCTGASVLQASAILVRDGKPQQFPAGVKANRMAIGQDEDRVVIIGAFTSFGTALSLADFANWIAAAAPKMKRNGLDAVNLDGGCSAQLSIPHLKRRFGCDTPGYNINRIVVRREP
ncbi:MAG TPA: phosphodiester glycosidase family protein, partial [Thermoanaerobaculia bacterium]|nr:phosphodiester glycosidase family protein [Thermoanaerobaculia bacterium]